MDLIDRQTAIDTFHAYAPGIPWDTLDKIFAEIPSVQASGDLIDRQAAIDALKEEEYPCESDYDEGYMAALDKAVWIIERWLPSAQPERKKGKWIKHPEVKNIYGGLYIECSECGEKYVVQHIGDEKFCRNCGADMRGEQK